MRLLEFQHIACEHPGQLRCYLNDDGIDWPVVELDAGAPIPPLEHYDALWVMGGPMDVWEVEAHPRLVAEKAAIRRWVRELDRPFLGVCLGHQLLTDALGGACAPQRPPEIGILEVELTPDGQADPIFAGLPARQKALQWHAACVSRPPDEAVVLAHSEVCPNQAMRVGRHAWSMQYHVEVEPDTIDNWGAVPVYAQALEAALGAGALDRLRADAAASMADFAPSAERLYRNFMATVSRPVP